MVGNDTYTSIVDSTQEIREIRSHRAPRKSHHRLNVIAAAVFTVSSLTPVITADATPHTSVAPVAAAEPVTRPVTVSRSYARSAKASVAFKRTQRITKVITFAKAQQGARYRFGATGPHAYDCSGLVMKSYTKANVKLPHFTGSLLHKGKKVSRKNLKVGDLIFPSRGHVGIYAGGNKMYAASSGRDRVIKQTVYSFYTARRIL